MKELERYSPVERELAVRLVFDQQGQHTLQWAAIQSAAINVLWTIPLATCLPAAPRLVLV